ncbi:VOC family protein [Citricoccus sp. GCM10030269]|uniref:VOC family protein n=1 Tax=Citricoccus sp. GCM10030269 TaxID=3273388 RepID=UPI0036191DDD
MVLTADDVDAAAEWYVDFFGIQPYFRRPESGPAAYVEFRIGPDEDELGIMSRSFAPAGSSGSGTSITYWQVEDVSASVDDLIRRGAHPHTRGHRSRGGFHHRFRDRSLRQATCSASCTALIGLRDTSRSG